MIMLYLFDVNGVCVRAGDYVYDTPEAAKEISDLSGAHHYVLSEVSHKIDKVYAGPDGEMLLIPARPHPYSVFVPLRGQWIDPRTIADRRAAKWNEIKLERNAVSTIETPYGIFDADENAIENIRNNVVSLREQTFLGTAPATLDWTLADNSVVTITPANLSEVFVLLSNRANAAHNKARGIRARIANATIATIDSINWSSNG